MEKTRHNGAHYFFKGFEIIQTKGLRRFVFIPLTVNILLFAAAFSYAFSQLDYYFAKVLAVLPEWLMWLEYLMWPITVITMLIMFSFVFSAFANWLAAPFNGLLSEKVEILLTQSQPHDTSFKDLMKDIPRTLSREWCKFRYYLPKAIGFFIVMMLLPGIGQLIWFLFVAWMMAIQYCDYPFDNHKIDFQAMKRDLSDHKSASYSFGIMTAVFAMIPLVNLIVMPVAICGATALWVDYYRDDYTA